MMNFDLAFEFLAVEFAKIKAAYRAFCAMGLDAGLSCGRITFIAIQSHVLQRTLGYGFLLLRFAFYVFLKMKQIVFNKSDKSLYDPAYNYSDYFEEVNIFKCKEI